MKYFILLSLILSGCNCSSRDDIDLQSAAQDVQENTDNCNELAKDLKMSYAKYRRETSGQPMGMDPKHFVCDITDVKPHKKFKLGLLFTDQEMKAIKRYRLIKKSL